jgi:UDP-3-O-[3-hydroxymyristoyl] glucosamine N-acyltransferase
MTIHSSPLTFKEIAVLTGIPQEGLEGGCIQGVASLETAGPKDVSFFHQLEARPQLEKTQASACFIRPSHASWAPSCVRPLVTEDPYRAFVILARHFIPEEKISPSIHPSAIIHPLAHVPETCHVAPGAVIEAHAVLGEGCFIGANTVIGPHVSIGDFTIVEPLCTIAHTQLGSHVRIKSGARIGQRGFGFIMDHKECLDIPHPGKVLIGDYTEIGANCTIDRGSFQNTVIGSYCKIDNLVQIAHNVVIGHRVIIASQCGIAGGCIIESGCMLGGQVGLAGHLTLKVGTRIAAKSGVMRSSQKGETLAGIPAVPAHQWRRQVLHHQKTFSSVKSPSSL